jgi:UDP-GlcNAc:undecaprenyl-phosphate/decaprenyl-phosphate GlcNAc-1-phosphate transferase
MNFILIFLFAFLLAFVATPLAGLVGRRLGLADAPGGRRQHAGLVPRTGGMALCLAFTAAALFAQWLPVPRFDPNEIIRLIGLLTGGVFIFLFGLADDRWNIPPRWQYLIHAAAAAIAILFLLFVQYFYNPLTGDKVIFPLWLTVAFTLFWIMGMVNTVNWLDGLNGLAAGVTAIACAVLFINAAFRLDPPQISVSLLPLALLGVCLGFLPWNLSARVFMGSSGAWFLGYTLSCLAIIGGAKVAAILLVMAVPIIDVAWLIFRRATRGASVGAGGRDHLHFRLLDAGVAEWKIVTGYYAFCAAFGALALVTSSRLYKLVALVVLGILVLIALWQTERHSQ